VPLRDGTTAIAPISRVATEAPVGMVPVAELSGDRTPQPAETTVRLPKPSTHDDEHG
jgi:hypothetical protein